MAADRHIFIILDIFGLFFAFFTSHTAGKKCFPKLKEESLGDMNLQLSTQNHKDQVFYYLKTCHKKIEKLHQVALTEAFNNNES